MQKQYLIAIFVLFFGLTFNAQSVEFVTIGTGSVTGVYYPAGGAIAKMLNNRKDTYGIKASVESTPGSVYNINSVLSGDLDFGITQSDRQFQAYKGNAEWKKNGPQKKLRSVFSLHPEIVTLVAADDAGIKSLTDLRGKRVNIGNPGSGSRQNAIDVIQNATKLDWKKEIKAESLKASEAPKMLQDNRIDAFFYTVGHPSGAISEATSGKRKVHFVPITGLSDFVKKYPYYAEDAIPADLYPNATNKKPTPSVGIMATLVTSENVSEDVVYALTKVVFENFKKFKELHPAFANLKKDKMMRGLTAPIHKGALKYYKEAGLMK